jgi:Fe-S-cluster containining protein
MSEDTSSHPGSPESMTANLEMSGPGWRLRAAITVPTGPTRLRQLLPMVKSFTDTVVSRAVQASEDQARPVSCKKGCAACCRQLIPLSRVEARHIAQVVEELPEPRRRQVRARFAGARERLAEAGILDKLQARGQWTDEGTRPMGLAYFRLGIPCPFLEQESCSIYPDRPLACREYLVTSPPENCSQPTAETVHSIKLPLKVSTAVHCCEKDGEQNASLPWIPLILAPEWAAAHAEEGPSLPGPRWVEKLIRALTGKEISSNPALNLPFSS